MPIDNLLLCCTGSVASIKIPLLVEKLAKFNVKVVCTKASLHFFDYKKLPCPVYLDEDEWVWSGMGDPILHIELRNWADLVLIAPLDANTLAKLSNGICDNLLTCVLRAWNFKKPVLVAPAMNTDMWNNKHTAKHLNYLIEEFGYIVIAPISKLLACGDYGAMAEVDTIVDYCDNFNGIVEKSVEMHE